MVPWYLNKFNKEMIPSSELESAAHRHVLSLHSHTSGRNNRGLEQSHDTLT